MAKASPQSYQVTNLSDLSYNGKVVPMGSVVDDVPGESIGWLLSDGFIIASNAPVVAEKAPLEAPVTDATTPSYTPAPAENVSAEDATTEAGN
jgi:hypothetical protein